MSAVKAVIFDCDGILIDSEHAHYKSWQYALKQEGGDLSLKEYYSYVGKSLETNARLLAEKIGSANIEAIIANKQKHYSMLQKNGLHPIQHVVDFVIRLAKDKKKHGFKLAVASAAKKEEILINLNHLEIEHLFEVIVSGQDDLKEYSDKDGVNKPKPYIYLQTAKSLNLPPQVCIVIEDSLSGITAGNLAGCKTIAVPNAFTCNQDLSSASHQIESFKEIFSYEDLMRVIN